MGVPVFFMTKKLTMETPKRDGYEAQSIIVDFALSHVITRTYTQPIHHVCYYRFICFIRHV